MIRAEHISKRHAGEWVLRDISLEIPKGCYLGIIGPGGAGKSLLAKILTGLVEPDEGKAFIDGHDVHSLDAAQLAELRFDIGMLFQNYALFDFMTVAENIAFPLKQSGNLVKAEIQRRVNRMLDRIGLPHVGDRYPRELSGGMKKRVTFARAVIPKPPILFYDDPTAGLDPVTSSKIFDLLTTIKAEQETTGVTISHDVGGIREISDRVAMLERGELIFEGTIAEIDNCGDERVDKFWEGFTLDGLQEKRRDQEQRRQQRREQRGEGSR